MQHKNRIFGYISHLQIYYLRCIARANDYDKIVHVYYLAN